MLKILLILSCFFVSSVLTEANCTQNLVYGKTLEGQYTDELSNGIQYLTNCNLDKLVKFVGTAWFAYDFTEKYLVEKVLLFAYDSVASSYYVMVMNNFDKVTNPPDPSVHYVCPTNLTMDVPLVGTVLSTGVKFETKNNVYESNCTQSPDMKGYRYVAFWFNSTEGLQFSEIEVYGTLAPNTTEATTTTAPTTFDATEVSTKTLTSTHLSTKLFTVSHMTSARNIEQSATKMTQKAPTTKGENLSAADATYCCFSLICVTFFIALFM